LLLPPPLLLPLLLLPPPLQWCVVAVASACAAWWCRTWLSGLDDQTYSWVMVWQRVVVGGSGRQWEWYVCVKAAAHHELTAAILAMKTNKKTIKIKPKPLP
jgi:hypothetical protein